MRSARERPGHGPPLIASARVAIRAPIARVWATLTSLRCIGQWDDLPDEYAGDFLAHGSEMVWKRIDGGHTKLTVTVFEPGKRLRLSLHASHWPLPPAAYDVRYTYDLAESEGRTLLHVEIGDFAALPHGREFYDASREFADRAARKIRELAETPALPPAPLPRPPGR